MPSDWCIPITVSRLGGAIGNMCLKSLSNILLITNHEFRVRVLFWLLYNVEHYFVTDETLLLVTSQGIELYQFLLTRSKTIKFLKGDLNWCSKKIPLFLFI